MTELAVPREAGAADGPTGGPAAGPAATPRTGPGRAPAHGPGRTRPAAPAPRHRPPAGRETLVGTVLAHLDDGDGVLLTGPAGIGRTTLLDRVAGARAAGGHRVLRCSPSPADRHSPYLGLIDLLSGVGDDLLVRLEARERALLEGALLRAPLPPGADLRGGRDRLVLRFAATRVLGLLREEGPLLLAVDDAQWLDEPTADVLGFAAGRRTGAGHEVLVALRDDDPGAVGPGAAGRGTAGPGAEGPAAEALCPRPVRGVAVPPLTVPEAAELLDAHDQPVWPRPLVARLHAAGGGIPGTVLALSRALGEQVQGAGGELPDAADPLPVPAALRLPVRTRLDALPGEARRMLLAASLAANPTAELLVRAGCADASAHIDLCVRRGLLERPAQGALRFADPLVAVVLRADAGYETRVDAHRALAGATDDPVERAHHLAMLTVGPDAEVAARLSEAAGAARRRGAPGTAARLGRLAAERTPAGQGAVDADRRLTAAEDAVSAGDFAFARRLAREVLADARDAAVRVRAWIVVVDSCGQALAEVADVLPEAVRDAGSDPGLLAQLHYRMSWREWMVGGSAARAHGHAVRAAGLAGRAGDRRTELMALTQQAALELFLGMPAAETTLGAALAAPYEGRVMADHNGPVYLKHRFHVVHDRLDEARAELRALVFTQRQRGSAESLSQCLGALAQVEIDRGRCRQALGVARQSLRVAEQAGLSLGPAWYAVALAETAGGSAGQALAAAEAARRHSEDDADRLFLPRALHAEGRIRLLGGEYEAAAGLLRRTGELETAQGQRDPATRRWHGDLAEALAGCGALEEAERVLSWARPQAERLGRACVVAVLDRAAAVVGEARGDLLPAAGLLEDAVRRLRAAGYPLEEARTALALGRVRRGLGDETAARAAFAESLRIFTRAGARGWIAVARAERDRSRAAAVPGEGCAWSERLTSTERCVVARVAQGATNREIAAGLVVSVKTVEAALTRAYRKLGARSRVEVTRIVMAGQAG
ncbi:AAA family ATPase [Streptomyces sp. NPDC021020]|uniref:helix-turn-helix transcriptional regulator n=1 Tax=Streptomyces sp. NPDC021020 TaxID=3365109 RepID=UPI0037AA3C3D